MQAREDTVPLFPQGDFDKGGPEKRAREEGRGKATARRSPSPAFAGKIFILETSRYLGT